jgi:hypothetical protein
MVKVRSKFVVVIAAAIGVALLIACYAVQTKPAAAAAGGAGAAKAATVIVRDTAGVVAALKSAGGGDTILLAPGAYTTLGLQKVNISGGQVTIASADPTKPAVIAGIEIANCSGLAFRDLEVTLNARLQTVFNVADSQDIRLDRLNFHGVAGGDKPGLMFRNSANVSVKNSKFHDLGTALTNMDSNHVTVSGNHFHDIRGDGVQTTGSSNVTIAGNHFTDFHTAPGDHPDAIQFFTYRQKAPAQNITIVDNIIVRGKGDIIQGIFLGNEIKMPYVDVKISGNKVIGAMYNGIAVGVGQNVTITDNLVQGYRDQDSWIMISGSTNASASNNQSTGFIEKENTGAKIKDNRKLKAAKVGDISALGAPPTD